MPALAIAQNFSSFSVSVYTSPTPLGKRIALKPNGALAKRSLGQIVDGTVRRETFESLTQFAEIREALTPNDALGYGLTAYPVARVVTKAALASMSDAEKVNGGVPVVARDARHLSFSAGAGILMIDHDPVRDQPGLCADTLHSLLCEAMPELRQVTMLWAPSTSSMIYAGEKQVAGLRGSRVYFVVSDARCVPSIGRLLFDRLVLGGHGHIAVSGAGSLLRRGPIDTAVWQAERLDFVKATYSDGLVHRPPPWQVFKGEGPDESLGDTMLDVSSITPLAPSQISNVRSIWRTLEADPETLRLADEQKQRASMAGAARALGKDATPEMLESLSARMRAAAECGHVEPECVLLMHDGSEVSVGEVLDSPARYLGWACADPLESDYLDDRRIARICTSYGRIAAVSFAHGGRTIYLERSSTAEEDFGVLDDGQGDLSESWPTVSNPSPSHVANSILPPLEPGKRRGADIASVAQALRFPGVCGWRIGVDAFRADVMLADPSDQLPQWRTLVDNDYTRLREHLERVHNFKPISREMMRDSLLMVAAENEFDSAQTWLERLSWDGVPRVEPFLPRYFGAADTPYHRAIGRYIWSALAGRVAEPGAKCDMVPVAVGAQGTRKSSAIAAMAPAPDFYVELDLRTRDADTARRLRGKLVVELAELRGLGSADAESIKAFLSARTDSWVPKYQERATSNPRRCLFFGSSNRDDFLRDDSGHRRWLPFDSGVCDPGALASDCEQLWAEAQVRLFLYGLEHEDAERLAREEHERFEDIDEWTTDIAEYLAAGNRARANLNDDDDDDVDEVVPFEQITVREVLQGALHFSANRIGKREEMRASVVLKKLGWTKVSRRVNGVPTKLYLPPRTGT